MTKMRYFSDKILKKRWELCYQRPLNFDFSDLKLRDLVKLCFFQTDCDKIVLKKSVMTSHRKTLPN